MAESGYSYNAGNQTLEHYYEKPPDYNENTYQAKEALLNDLSDCRFSFWDGEMWQSAWQEIEQLPKVLKINFKFKGETKEEEFVVNIPVAS